MDQFETFTVEKKTVVQYHIRPSDGFGWGIFMIDFDNYLVSANTDFGNYSYQWSSPGSSFKKFLVRIFTKDHNYVMGKFGSNEYIFDYKKTMQSFKKMILERRRNHDCTREEAREAYDLIDTVDLYGYDNNPDLLLHTLLEKKIPANALFYEDIIHGMEYKRCPRLVNFCEILLPMLAEVLQKELEEEAAAVTV
jgi:hypothetical protein